MTLQIPVKTPGTGILGGHHTQYIYIACLPCIPFNIPFLAESPCSCAGESNFLHICNKPPVQSWCLRRPILHNDERPNGT